MIDIEDVFALHPLDEGAVVALRGLTLTVRQGERVVIYGPNGSGKTTLLRLLTGDLPSAAGRVHIDGAPPRRGRIGVVDQRAGRALRDEYDVADNVGLALRLRGISRQAARQAAMALLGDLDLAHLCDRVPSTLSGGEAQRVAVAAALVTKPQVLVADEPTGSLDIVAAQQVQELLRDYSKSTGMTLVVVTHDTRAATMADRVLRLRDGRVSEEWAPGGQETSVVDVRGWMRLPERVRIGLGNPTAVHATVDESTGRLVATGQRDMTTETAPWTPYAGPLTDVLTMQGVSVRRGDRDILTPVSVEARTGQIVAIAGPSGSGKSTLLAVALGMVPPSSGEIRLVGRELAGLSRGDRALARRGNVAVADQRSTLEGPLDARDNLESALARYGSAASVDDLLRSLDLDAVTGRPTSVLSGGEQQRVAVAAALGSRCPLVVLDEPTSAQDEGHATLVAQAMVAAAHRDGSGVVVATHDPRLLEVADVVVRL